MASPLQKELLMLAIILAVGAFVVYQFLPDVKEYVGLDEHEDDNEEEDEEDEPPCSDCDQQQKTVGETDPSEILKGVKRGSMITYPESTRTIADSLYGVNRAQGICGRDTEGNLESALAKAKEGYNQKDCRVNRYYNMPAHLESAILGKAKIY